MQKENSVVFYFGKRHAYGKKEYYLSLQIDGGYIWTIETWSKKPTKQEIEKTKAIIERSFEVYARNVKLVLPRMSYTDWS